MIAIPAATGVIKPIDELTVATISLELVNVPPVSPLLEKVVVPFVQTDCIPLNIPAIGDFVTITITLALVGPKSPVAVAVIVAVP